MSVLQGTAFVVLIAMVPVWFYCLRKLSHQLRDRHPEKYDEMDLENLWSSRRYGNRRAVSALCSFLFRGEFRSLDDPEVASLSNFMRRFAVVYLALFGLMAYSVLTQLQSGSAAQGARVVAPAAAPARVAPVAATPVAAPASTSEGDLLYSRAFAHAQAGRTEQALADFRRVIELDPSNFGAHRHVDHLLAGQQRWDEILALWDAYLIREPRDPNAYWERGGTHYRKKDFAAAHADATKACELGMAEACGMAERLKSKL